MQWIENEELFATELAQGFLWQMKVAQYLKQQGFAIKVPDIRFRDDVQEINKFEDEPDIHWCGKVFEVKSRKLHFTGPHDFPYQTILVDTVRGWQSKTHKPDTYICISTVTEAMICLPGETQKDWIQCPRFDHIRKIKDTFYEAPKNLWISMDTLIQQMHTYLRYQC